MPGPPNARDKRRRTQLGLMYAYHRRVCQTFAAEWILRRKPYLKKHIPKTFCDAKVLIPDWFVTGDSLNTTDYGNFKSTILHHAPGLGKYRLVTEGANETSRAWSGMGVGGMESGRQPPNLPQAENMKMPLKQTARYSIQIAQDSAITPGVYTSPSPVGFTLQSPFVGWLPSKETGQPQSKGSRDRDFHSAELSAPTSYGCSKITLFPSYRSGRFP